MHLLVNKLGKAKDGGIKFYSLDNEPALWPSTHPRIHPERTALRRDREAHRGDRHRGREAGSLARRPWGAVAFGWSEFTTLSDAPDAKEHNDKYGSYLDYFLASMKELEAKHKKRLVHVLDVHWYPEARGTKRITDKDNSPKTVAARLQAPRSLWDPTYMEKSWITGLDGKADPPDPVAARRDRRSLPGHEARASPNTTSAAPDHSRAGWRRPTCWARSGARVSTWATTGTTAPGTACSRLHQGGLQPVPKLRREEGAFGDTAVRRAAGRQLGRRRSSRRPTPSAKAS